MNESGPELAIAADGTEPVAVQDETDLVAQAAQETSSKKRFSFGKKKGKSAKSEYTGDLMMVMGIYSSLCGIATVYSDLLPVVEAGVEAAFWMVIVIGLLFTYSIDLVVIGLRPNETTMLDAIIGEAWPATKLPLQILGQFTSGWMMILFQWLGFDNNSGVMQAAFCKMYTPISVSGKDKLTESDKLFNKWVESKNTKSFRNMAIINIFITLLFSAITNPAIFVPLTTLPTYATILGFIAVIWWVSKNTTHESLKGFKEGWSHKSGNWETSTSAGLTAMFTLVGVLAGNFYLHSMIQQLLARAKFPEHNIRNTCAAFGLSIITILFTNLVAALPFTNYNGSAEMANNLPTNLANGMGTAGLIRASNIVLWLLSIPIIPFQWAVLRQNTIDLIPWKGSKLAKLRWPTIILYQCAIVLIGFGITWAQTPLQIMIQVATFPAAVYWVCFMPVFFHIWDMNRTPELRSKWYFWPWVCTDVIVGIILFFCEIVQFIPHW